MTISYKYAIIYNRCTFNCKLFFNKEVSMLSETIKKKTSEKEIVVVKFDVSANIIKGNIMDGHVYSDRCKIVFINGYKPGLVWKGDLPTNGEEWLCQIIRDTDEESDYRGAIIVRLIDNLTYKKFEETMKKEKKLTPILKYFKYEDVIGRILFAEKIKKFAEETIVPNKLLSSIKKMIGNEQVQAQVGQTEYLIFLLQEHGVTISRDDRLRAVIDWLERAENVALMEDKGQRYFSCGCCKTMFRLGKTEYREYKIHSIIRCPDCGANSGKK